MKRIYFDHAATTPVRPEVLAAIQPYFSEKYGNPSSLHSFGQETRAAVEEARGKLARLLVCSNEEILFTSGGTESDNLALQGVAYANRERGNQIITSAVEHHAVSECLEFLGKNGFEITVLPVDEHGLVSPESVARAITPKTILVSIMHANNEIGTIEPIAEIAEVIHQRNEPRTTNHEPRIYFHTDAVQTFGHLPTKVDELGVDLLSISAHKLNGPKGVGALYVRKGTRLRGLVFGGRQERGRRPSTENVPGIVGFGVAAELAHRDMGTEKERLLKLRERLVRGLLDRIPDCRLNGHPSLRLPGNVNVSVRYVEGEAMLLNLDLEGIAASTGSACSSGSLEPSHVMLAIGLSHEEAHGSLRFSLGWGSTEEEIDRLLELFPKIVEKLRAMSPLYHGKAGK